jgi:hypothetical protein
MEWRKARLHGRPTLSVNQAREWRDQDRAAKWLAKAEQRRERRYVTSRSTQSTGWSTVADSTGVPW